MRLALRIGAIVAAFIASLLITAVALIYFNQQRLIVAVLASVKQQTGIDIVPVSSHIQVRNHLIVELDQPRVMSGNHEIVALRKIRAVVNFRTMFTHGLPLRELDLEGAVLNAPFDATASRSGAIPRPDTAIVKETLARLTDLARISRRFVIADLELRDRSGVPLLSHTNLSASHRRATPKLWSIGFDADCEFPRMRGARAAGDFKMGEGGDLPATDLLQGTFWFWQLPLKRLTIGNLEVDGQSHGRIRFALALDAVVKGVAVVGLKTLTVRSPDLSSPLELGNYSVEASFNTSTEQVAISSARLTHEGKPIVAAQAYIQRPYEPNAQVGIGISSLKVAWKDILASMRRLKRLPQEVEAVIHRVKTGRIEVAKASIDSPLSALENLSFDSILARLSVNATLSELSFAAPESTRLPEVTGASIQIILAHRILSLLQGTAKIGASELRDIVARIELKGNLEELPYQIAMQGDLDLAELRPAMVALLDQFNVHERDRLTTVSGNALVELEVAGTLKKNLPTHPEKYQVKIEPRNVIVGFRGAPGPIGFASGSIVLRPDLIKLDKVSARATGGTADFDGELQLGKVGVETHGLRIAMHQMPIDRWLEVLVDPDDLSAAGNVGGEVMVTGNLQNGILVNGKITLQDGRVQLGFLRSPIFVHPMIVTVRDHTLVVTMPAAELEKSPINFDINIADLRNPSIRVDANVQKLDVEVLKFVRLPWMPPTPTHPPKFPISGHLDAREANLESLAMKNAKTDFKYSNGDWSVDNLTASSMEGHLSLNLAGRKKDDWMHIFGRAQDMSAAAIFLLKSGVTQAPLSGRLDATLDCWADTDGDFFSTLGGTVIVKLRDGTLDRFTLLSRLFEMIDLRSWLTANVPDPRTSGLQFRTVSADFKGNEGIFYTDDLLLDGPVIDIVASGNVNLDRSTLDMKVGMIPFNTVNWLLSGIPLVGKNVAGGTKSIISAYLNVRGPITNPHVTPAPISTLAELLKKTLGLPINLIRPDTIK